MKDFCDRCFHARTQQDRYCIECGDAFSDVVVNVQVMVPMQTVQIGQPPWFAPITPIKKKERWFRRLAKSEEAVGVYVCTLMAIFFGISFLLSYFLCTGTSLLQISWMVNFMASVTQYTAIPYGVGSSIDLFTLLIFFFFDMIFLIVLHISDK